MTTSTHLIGTRRFLPLFVTQLLGAFNDNLFKNAMVLYVVYSVYNSEAAEARFSAVASALFIIPFFVLSALSGQMADMRDKAQIIRVVKFCEIPDHAGGRRRAGDGVEGNRRHHGGDTADAGGIVRDGHPFPFFGPIKYAILPQHLKPAEVLAGTGLVEGGDLYRHSGRHDPGRLDQCRMGGADRRGDRDNRLYRRAPGAPRPSHGPARTVGLPYRSVVVRARAQHDAGQAGFPGDHGDQLFLDHRRGAVHPVPAARQTC